LTIQEETHKNFLSTKNLFYHLYKRYYLDNEDEIFKEFLINSECLSSKCLKLMESDMRFQDLFQKPEFVIRTLSEEFLELQNMFFTNSLIKVSQRASLALNSTNISDMYLYDFDSSEIEVKQLNWAQKAYENFLDFKNDILLCEGKKPLKEFPIIGSTFTELIEFWTQFYALNTMRLLLTLINKLQKQLLNNGFTKEDFR
jgi:hypothetical protein